MKPFSVQRREATGALLCTEANYTANIGALKRLNDEMFTSLYPDLFLKLANRSDSECIPDCSPPAWRTDLVRRTIQMAINRNNQSMILNPSLFLVPIWWQLVARRYPLSRHKGDCTHKNSNGMWTMNQQLVRSLILRKQREHGHINS